MAFTNIIILFVEALQFTFYQLGVCKVCKCHRPATVANGKQGDWPYCLISRWHCSIVPSVSSTHISIDMSSEIFQHTVRLQNLYTNPKAVVNKPLLI